MQDVHKNIFFNFKKQFCNLKFRMKLSDLNPNPRNPRKISDKKLKLLQKSLEKFGDLSGIVFNKATQQLVGGHQRTKVIPEDATITIARKFSKPTQTGTIALGHIVVGEEVFAYREVLWDEATEKAANIAANKHGGDFDIPILSMWLMELDQHNIDLSLTGFTEKELENLLAPIPKEDKQISDYKSSGKECPECGYEF